MLLTSLLIATVSFAQTPKFEGVYLQAMRYKEEMSRRNCAQAEGRFEGSSEEGYCHLSGTNEIEITKAGKNYSAKFAITSETGADCNGKILMKAAGNELVPAAKIQGASSEYKIVLSLADDEIDVQETFGDAEKALGRSPACPGTSQTLTGNGHKFERN